MIEVSDNLKKAFLSGKQKNLILEFDDGTTLSGESIMLESMTIEQTLCAENQLTFGTCAASVFKVDIFYGAKTYVGLKCKVTLETEYEGQTYSFTLGTYKIDENPVSDDHSKRTLVGYDALFDVVNTDYAGWYKGLSPSLPMTLRSFRNAFFNHIGIEQVSVSLPNDNVTIEKTIETNTLSGAEILKRIMEINATFGFINYDGKFQYVLYDEGTGLYPSTDLYPATDLYPMGASAIFGSDDSPEYGVVAGSLKYDDYDVTGITGIKIRQDDEDEGVFVGTDTNFYSISGNYLLFGKTASELQMVASNILSNANSILYRPAQFKARCCPWLELGDVVYCYDHGVVTQFPILERSISGITALYDTYKANGTEVYTEKANSISSMVENLKSKTLRIVQNVDEVTTELTEKINDTNDALEQTTEQIQTRITQTTEAITLAYQQEISDKAGEITEYVNNEITNTNNGIVLKVDRNGNIGKVTLGTDPDTTFSKSVIFKVEADNLNLSAQDTIDLMAGGTINLTSENIAISSTYFTVDKLGNVTANSLTLTGGTIDLSNDNTGHFFKVDRYGRMSCDLQNLSIDTSGNVEIKGSGSSIKIGDYNDDTGHYTFEVDEDGNLYANGASINGDIISEYENKTAQLSSGDLTFYRDGSEVAIYSSMDWDGHNGVSIYSPSGSDFISFNQGDGKGKVWFVIENGKVVKYYKSTETNLVVNYGLNPYGIEEGIIAFSGMSVNKMTFHMIDENGVTYYPDEWYMEPELYSNDKGSWVGFHLDPGAFITVGDNKDDVATYSNTKSPIYFTVQGDIAVRQNGNNWLAVTYKNIRAGYFWVYLTNDTYTSYEYAYGYENYDIPLEYQGLVFFSPATNPVCGTDIKIGLYGENDEYHFAWYVMREGPTPMSFPVYYFAIENRWI